NGLETLVIIMVANKYAFLQITRRRFLNEWEAFKKVISRRNIRRRITIPLTLSNLKLLRRITDRKSGSAGMPRPISYAVFCLKKKKTAGRTPPWPAIAGRRTAGPRSGPSGLGRAARIRRRERGRERNRASRPAPCTA